MRYEMSLIIFIWINSLIEKINTLTFFFKGKTHLQMKYNNQNQKLKHTKKCSKFENIQK